MKTVKIIEKLYLNERKEKQIFCPDFQICQKYSMGFDSKNKFVRKNENKKYLTL